MVCYDESRPVGSEFSKDWPLPLLNSFYKFNEAIRTGATITFVAEGPEAERAMDVVKGLLERPTNPAEAFLEMVAGRPVSFPVADKTLEETVEEKLRAWGWDGIADEFRRRPQPKKPEPWKESFWT